MTKRLSIEGMTCGHCVAHVKSALSGVDGVSAVSVDLSTRLAVVEGTKLDDAPLREAVAEAGYKVVAIEP